MIVKEILNRYFEKDKQHCSPDVFFVKNARDIIIKIDHEQVEDAHVFENEVVVFYNVNDEAVFQCSLNDNQNLELFERKLNVC